MEYLSFKNNDTVREPFQCADITEINLNGFILKIGQQYLWMLSGCSDPADLTLFPPF